MLIQRHDLSEKKNKTKLNKNKNKNKTKNMLKTFNYFCVRGEGIPMYPGFYSDLSVNLGNIFLTKS